MVLCLIYFPTLSFPSSLQVEGFGPGRVGQDCKSLGWESGAPLGQPTSSSHISCWELRHVLGGYRCAGRDRALDPRQGELAESLVQVLALLCFCLIFVDAERVDGAGH